MLLPPGGTEAGRAGCTPARENMCTRACVPVDEKGGRKGGKGLESHIFLLKVKNQSLTLKKFMNF